MFIFINDSAKSDSRRSSGRSGTDHSRSQSKSNRGSTARSFNVQSVNYGADDKDDYDYMSRGIAFINLYVKGIGLLLFRVLITLFLIYTLSNY